MKGLPSMSLLCSSLCSFTLVVVSTDYLTPKSLCCVMSFFLPFGADLHPIPANQSGDRQRQMDCEPQLTGQAGHFAEVRAVKHRSEVLNGRIEARSEP